MSKSIAHCSCKDGVLPERPVNLYPTETIKLDDMDVCKHCYHVAVYLRPNQCVHVVDREVSEVTKFIQADITVKTYLMEEAKERGNL